MVEGEEEQRKDEELKRRGKGKGIDRPRGVRELARRQLAGDIESQARASGKQQTETRIVA